MAKPENVERSCYFEVCFFNNSKGEGNALLKNCPCQPGTSLSMIRNNARPSSCDQELPCSYIKNIVCAGDWPGGAYFSVILYCAHIADPSSARKMSSSFLYPSFSLTKNLCCRSAASCKAAFNSNLQESTLLVITAFHRWVFSLKNNVL